jgi:hypothetical protein
LPHCDEHASRSGILEQPESAVVVLQQGMVTLLSARLQKPASGSRRSRALVMLMAPDGHYIDTHTMYSTCACVQPSILRAANAHLHSSLKLNFGLLTCAVRALQCTVSALRWHQQRDTCVQRSHMISPTRNLLGQTVVNICIIKVTTVEDQPWYAVRDTCLGVQFNTGSHCNAN